MLYTGKCWKYGDDVNTDVLFPGKYTYNLPPSEFAKHALEDLDPDFAKHVKPGDIVVGGRNFGCGSSREQAAVCVKLSGVTIVIAKSFARIYFRNCVNNGVLPLVCPDAVDAIHHGDKVSVDLEKNLIHVGERSFGFPSLSGSVKDIIDAGGLILMLRRKLGTEHLPMPEIKFSSE
ncbi:MAG: 3-isopropylmalate dehydratase [Anaerolineae bacterium]|nr:3-isopropylmalate dehydratase [Anaerolineae bacterium]